MDDALRDSFNTPVAMAIIESLITKSNVYIAKRKSATDSLAMLEEVARWIRQMVGIFGLDPPSSSSATSTGGVSASTAIDDATLGPFIRGVSKYRDAVRRVAMATAPAKKELLQLSDGLRDNEFVSIGVSLDDRDAGQAALVKAVPRETLLAARAAKREEAALAERRRDEARLERERVERERSEKGRLSHLDMFRTDEYGAWDDEGMPTKDQDGAELTKSRTKKLRKDWERQKKAHETWVAGKGQAEQKAGG